jgi:uncharacterized protein (DUF2236 family)
MTGPANSPKRPASTATKKTLQPHQVSIDWSNGESQPVFYANSFIASVLGPNEILIQVGQVTPPVFSGTPEQQTAQASRIKSLNATVGARIMLTVDRLPELIKTLNEVQVLHRDVKSQQSIEKGTQ